MKEHPLKLVVIGLSISSAWGNGHATTYRALLREWRGLGHQVLFLEKDAPWYAEHRDLGFPPFCELELYRDFPDLRKRFRNVIAEADVVIVGSYVADGVAIGAWVQEKARGVVAFYDIDTPVTLAKLERGDFEYLSPDLIPGYDYYFSFAGGPTLQLLENCYGSPAARALYCSADPTIYFPEALAHRWKLGYLGTYSADRQPGLDALLLTPATRFEGCRFVVAGPQYPEDIPWPGNVDRIDHVPPIEHRHFYSQQAFTLNVTRADMRQAGHSPSVRLFEAAACGVPIMSDWWDGLETFFEPEKEILIVHDSEEVVHILRNMPGEERREIGARARERVMREHTPRRRAQMLLDAVLERSEVSAR